MLASSAGALAVRNFAASFDVRFLPPQADIQAEALAGVHDAAVQMIDTSVVHTPGPVLHRGQQGRAVSIKLSIVGVATRYDKLAANYLAFVKLACIRLWLRVYKFTTW